MRHEINGETASRGCLLSPWYVVYMSLGARILLHADMYFYISYYYNYDMRVHMYNNAYMYFISLIIIYLTYHFILPKMHVLTHVIFHYFILCSVDIDCTFYLVYLSEMTK